MTNSLLLETATSSEHIKSLCQMLRGRRMVENSAFAHFKHVAILVMITGVFWGPWIVSGERVEILMSNVTTQEDDAYICTSYKLGEDQTYITNVEPLTNADIAHHMFAFGCDKPASTSNSWNCGSVVCQGPKTILFAWGRNAPELKLPDDVAYKVGPSTSYKYIVVNIHYLKKVDNDRSGLAISVTNKPRRYQAGIMLLVSSYINIPPKVPKYSSDFSCKYEGKNLNVFAFRVHAHMHGDVNAAYRVRNHEWVQLAKGDPQWPQAFYPLDNTLDLKDGDAIVGRCTYHNDENRYVTAGSTHTDEMCNVYLMYYADTTEGVQDKCYGNTYPALEEIIPSDATRRPAPPSTMKLNDDGTRKDIMSHHDMEGSKLHHDLSDLFKGSGGSNSNIKDQKSLAYILSQGTGSSANDDYYNDVETSRSKSRTNVNVGKGGQASNDYDTLTDDLIGTDSGSSSSDDYDSAALLAAAVAEQLNSAASGNSKKSDLTGKIKNLIQQQPITITKYSLIENWYDSKAANLGQIGGIAINQKNENMVVFHRGSQVWQMDSFNEEYRFNTKKYKVIDTDTIVTMNRNTGKVVNSWGANLFYMPHGLTIDSSGNIWVTDVGRHQVLKFAPNSSQPILEVGKRMEPGNDKTHFCQPADVAVLRNGDFYVADGYCNSRIVKFNKNGEYITEWSSDDQGLPSHFFVPHSLALHESQNLICVADRENYRVQCFDLNGNFLFETSSAEFGPIYSVAFAANNASVLYAVNGFNSKLENQFDKKIFLISTKTGKLIGSINLNEEAHTPHDLALSDDASEIYIADLNPALVFKYALVNYNFGKPDKRKLGNNTKELVLKDNVDGDKENFRTSMFIMTFLAVPVIAVIVVALIVRLKNTGRLKSMKLGSVGSKLDAKHKELGNWIKKTSNSKKRNGFTRLNQESDDEEAQRLNRNGSSGSNDLNRNSDDSDSASDNDVPMPTLSKA